MDLADFRKEYSDRGLHRDELDCDPIKQFESWFNQAIELKLHEPNAMSLATVSENGMPLLRTVLLKYFDQQGFVFFTNYESRKACHINSNPQVSLLFPWVSLERQVIVQGQAEKIHASESLSYFASRPPESQLGAWVSNQSSVIPSRSALIEKLHRIRKQFADGEIPLPPFWGGYRVVPESLEFWQGGPGRIHDRFLYRQIKRDWSIERLSP